MGVRINTEDGRTIELPAQLVADGDPEATEAFVAAERVKLGLPPTPPPAADAEAEAPSGTVADEPEE